MFCKYFSTEQEATIVKGMRVGGSRYQYHHVTNFPQNFNQIPPRICLLWSHYAQCFCIPIMLILMPAHRYDTPVINATDTEHLQYRHLVCYDLIQHLAQVWVTRVVGSHRQETVT